MAEIDWYDVPDDLPDPFEGRTVLDRGTHDAIPSVGWTGEVFFFDFGAWQYRGFLERWEDGYACTRVDKECIRVAPENRWTLRKVTP